ncbi:hypothetical protein L6164_029439 [Bauhinia variegata]|uniref:Uncharacterized protein n=1 Tax=Bauhinia variegata TaxID=167791 RepID=A0ACB9L9N0_BAUVA|nr:hypothetical protein L6164_029439 [Bauhinia variegata]
MELEIPSLTLLLELVLLRMMPRMHRLSTLIQPMISELRRLNDALSILLCLGCLVSTYESLWVVSASFTIFLYLTTLREQFVVCGLLLDLNCLHMRTRTDFRLMLKVG